MGPRVVRRAPRADRRAENAKSADVQSSTGCKDIQKQCQKACFLDAKRRRRRRLGRHRHRRRRLNSSGCWRLHVFRQHTSLAQRAEGRAALVPAVDGLDAAKLWVSDKRVRKEVRQLARVIQPGADGSRPSHSRLLWAMYDPPLKTHGMEDVPTGQAACGQIPIHARGPARAVHIERFQADGALRPAEILD